MNRTATKPDPRSTLSQADPWWHCAGCADEDHQHHVDVYVDAFGEDAACECPRCA